MSEEYRDTFEIRNALGLHARAAAKLVHTASRFQSDIRVEKEGQSADGKSVMGMLLLCGQHGARIHVSAHGRDAREAVRAIGELIADGFGEEE